MKFLKIRIGILKNDFSIYFENVHNYFYFTHFPHLYNSFKGPLINGNCYTMIKKAFGSCYGNLYKDYDLSREMKKECYQLVLEIPSMFKTRRTIKYVCCFDTKLTPFFLESTIEAFFSLDKYLETQWNEESKGLLEPVKDAGIELYFIGTKCDESRFNTSLPCNKFIKHKITMKEHDCDLIKSVCTFVY